MPDQFHPIELLQRYQYGALLLATTIAAVVTMWKTRSDPGSDPAPRDRRCRPRRWP